MKRIFVIIVMIMLFILVRLVLLSCFVAEKAPFAERSCILECFYHMKEVMIEVAGELYIILKCHDDFELSDTVSSELPNFVLIRQCTLDIMKLIQLIHRDKNRRNVRRFLITGTPGVGKSVSVIVWLYLAVKGMLNNSFRHFIADLKTGCFHLYQDDTGTWIEKWLDRRSLMTTGFPDTNSVLYLYDATFHKTPLILPYYSVVFSSPDVDLFKEFINIDSVLRIIYYTPVWSWDEIEALYTVSTDLQARAPLTDVKGLFKIWGGLPREIFAPYETGRSALISAINNCNAIACMQVREKDNFITFTEEDSNEIQRKLMQFDVVSDDTYQHPLVNFGSPFIRDRLVEKTIGRDFTTTTTTTTTT